MKQRNKNVLLVEGKNDFHVLGHLLNYHKVPEVLTIIDKEGFENIRETLDVELDRSGLECLGIIVDADSDINARWASLRDRLRNRGYTDCPDTPDPHGTIMHQQSKPTVGVWIMPDNTHPGMLEHFIEFLVPANNFLWQKAADCLQEIPEEERRFSPEHTKKAHLHTWLAWQQSPGTPMGWAITRKFLDPTAPHAHTLLAWLRRLFDLAPTSSTHESPTQAPGGPAQ